MFLGRSLCEKHSIQQMLLKEKHCSMSLLLIYSVQYWSGAGPAQTLWTNPSVLRTCHKTCLRLLYSQAGCAILIRSHPALILPGWGKFGPAQADQCRGWERMAGGWNEGEEGLRWVGGRPRGISGPVGKLDWLQQHRPNPNPRSWACSFTLGYLDLCEQIC